MDDMERDPSRIPLYLRAGLLAASGFLAITGCSAARETPDRADSCELAPVESDDLAKMDALTARLESAYIDPRLLIDLPMNPDGSLNQDEYHARKDAATKEVAASFGMTLKNPDETNLKIRAQTTLEDTVVAANEYFEPFGVTVQVPTKPEVYTGGAVKMTPLTAEEKIANLKTMQGNTQVLLLTNGELPIELVKAAGLNEIHFIKEFYTRNETTGKYELNEGIAGLADVATGIYYARMDQGTYTGTIFAHEFSHLLDEAYVDKKGCETLFNDLEFNSLNPEGVRYGEETYDISLISDESVRAKIDNSHAVFARRYGAKNVGEDKAVISEMLHTTFISMQRKSPVLQRKVDLLLLRADELAPGYLDYRIAISGKYPGSNEGGES